MSTPLSLVAHRLETSLSRAARCKEALLARLSRLDKPRDGKDAGKAWEALKRLCAFLLPLVRRRIGLLLALAVLRTALSNRMARMQAGFASLLFFGRSCSHVPLRVGASIQLALACTHRHRLASKDSLQTDISSDKISQLLCQYSA